MKYKLNTVLHKVAGCQLWDNWRSRVASTGVAKGNTNDSPITHSKWTEYLLLYLLLELLRWLGKMLSDIRVFSVYRTHISQYGVIRSREGALNKSETLNLMQMVLKAGVGLAANWGTELVHRWSWCKILQFMNNNWFYVAYLQRLEVGGRGKR